VPSAIRGAFSLSRKYPNNESETRLIFASLAIFFGIVWHDVKGMVRVSIRRFPDTVRVARFRRASWNVITRPSRRLQRQGLQVEHQLRRGRH